MIVRTDASPCSSPASGILQPAGAGAVACDFKQVFSDIIERKERSGKSGKEFALTLNDYELSVVQKSKLIADRINPSKLSAEGAENLFVVQGDNRKYVDLDNDGITEIGEGKVLIFPPPNSPDSVKDAWDETSKNMTFEQKMLVMGSFLAETVGDRNQSHSPSVRNPYGSTSQDFSDLIDRVVCRLKRFSCAAEEKFLEKHDFVIRSLGEFKKNIESRQSLQHQLTE